MTVPWLALSSLQSSLQSSSEPASDEISNLLRVTVVVVVVVVGVILLSLALRPFLPPAAGPRTEAEQDEATLRRLGLYGEGERATAEASGLPMTSIPFPPSARDPILDEDERIYGDPVIAARLKQVLNDSRRDERRAQEAGELVDDDPATAGLTEREQTTAVRGTVHHDEEIDPMSASTLESPFDSPRAGPAAVSEHSRGEPTTGPGQGRRPEGNGETAPTGITPEPVAGGRSQPRPKVVPFVPRQTPSDASPVEPAVDRSVVTAMTSAIRELLFCANVGELVHGFTLYSDRYLFRFMDETGLTVDGFREAFESAPAKEPDAWTRLSRLSDVRRLDDGRVSAVVAYLEGDRPSVSERYTFVFEADRGRWLVDDIEPV